MSRKEKELSGKQKAALLLISLGPEVSASVYKHTEQSIEKMKILATGRTHSTEVKELVPKFH